MVTRDKLILAMREAFSRRILLLEALCARLFAQDLNPEWKEKIDAAIPKTAPAKPQRPRRMLITNLSMRDGKPVRGSSVNTLPACNYAIGQLGKRTGAYEPVFSDDIEMFRPDKIR